MPRKAPRDYTMEEQLARGPLDLPFLMLTMMLLGIGLVMMFSASYAVAYYDPQVSSPYFYTDTAPCKNSCVTAAGQANWRARA